MPGSRSTLCLLADPARRRPILLPDVGRERDRLDPDLARIIAALVRGDAPWPLYLYGEVGTGKTCAALLLCDAVGGGCAYYTVESAAEDRIAAMKGVLFDQYTGGKIHPHQWRANWRAAKLGVLDELGIRNCPSDAETDLVKAMVDTRKGRPIVLIGNGGPEDIARVYDDRIASRVCEGTVYELRGDDRRLHR